MNPSQVYDFTLPGIYSQDLNKIIVNRMWPFGAKRKEPLPGGYNLLQIWYLFNGKGTSGMWYLKNNEINKKSTRSGASC